MKLAHTHCERLLWPAREPAAAFCRGHLHLEHLDGRRLLRVRRLFAFDAGLPSAGQRVDVILVEVYVHTSAQLPRYVAAISFVLQATLYFKTCPRTCRDHSCDDETCKSALQLAWHNAKAQGSPAASSRNFSLAEAGGARVRRSSFRRGGR